MKKLTPAQKRKQTIEAKKLAKEKKLKKLAERSKVNEITIRSQKPAKNFQRYCIAVSMLQDGHSKSDIVERLLSESGIYAGTNKALSEKSTKNFVGKVVACYNGLSAGKKGKVAHEMTRLKNGLDVTQECTFKSYARLTYKASLA